MRLHFDQLGEDGDRTLSFLFTALLPVGGGSGEARARYRTLADEAAVSAGGLVFKNLGDAIHMAFETPADACAAGLRLMRAGSTDPIMRSAGVGLRAALHVGVAYPRDGDLFGAALNRCARLLALAQPGHLLATPEIAPHLPVHSRRVGVAPLDDPDAGVAIHLVVAEGLSLRAPPLADTTALPNNLPRALASFVGRPGDVVLVEAALLSGRWATLVGAGGLGKTRLAIEVGRRIVDAAVVDKNAERLRDGLDQGILFVELAPLARGDRLASAVAAAAGIELAGNGAPAEELAARLGESRLLLILDNCEHLADEVRALGALLLARCPDLRVLATSQRALEMDGEAVLRLDALPCPPAGIADGKEARTHAAFALLEERARAITPGFAVPPDAIADAAAICRAVDGLPLAIELVATRLAVLGAAAVRARLGSQLLRIAAPGEASEARHRTLERTIAWSHDLLEPVEQRVLRRLGAFRGSWTVDGGAAVAAGDGISETTAAGAIRILVDRSLVAPAERMPVPRFRLLEAVRAFAGARLAESGETDACEARHLALMERRQRACFAGWFEDADETLRARYMADLDDVRAALDRAGETAGRMRLLGAAEPLFAVLAQLHESRERFERASGALDSVPDDVAALVWRGYGLAFGFAHPAKAFDCLDRAVPALRTSGDPRLLGQALVMMGRLAQVVAERVAGSPALLDEAAPLIAASGSERLRAHLYRGLGNRAAQAGDTPESVRMLRRSFEAFTAAGALSAASTARTSLGYMLWADGQLEAALAELRAVLAERRASPFADGSALGFVLGNLVGILTEQGALEEARATIAEAIPLLERPWQLWVSFDHLALFLAKAGDLEAAAEAMGFADRAYADHGTVRQPNEARARASVEALIASLPASARERAEIEGASLTPEEAVALARTCLSA